MNEFEDDVKNNREIVILRDTPAEIAMGTWLVEQGIESVEQLEKIINKPQHQFSLEKELVITSKATIDRLLKRDKPGDLIPVYIFYYYTAKWQETSTVKATIDYVAKGVKIGRDRVIAAKKELVKLGLIEDVIRKNPKTNKITGWYVKINYVMWVSHPPENPTLAQENHPPENPQGGKTDTNALRTNNINALSTDKVNPSLTGEESKKTNGVKTEAPIVAKPYATLDSLTEPDFQEIADHYKVPVAFVHSKYEDMVLWVGQQDKPSKTKGRNWRLTLMNWVKRDALKIRKEDYDKHKSNRIVDIEL